MQPHITANRPGSPVNEILTRADSRDGESQPPRRSPLLHGVHAVDNDQVNLTVLPDDATGLSVAGMPLDDRTVCANQGDSLFGSFRAMTCRFVESVLSPFGTPSIPDNSTGTMAFPTSGHSNSSTRTKAIQQSPSLPGRTDNIAQTHTPNYLAGNHLFSESFLAKIKIFCKEGIVKDMPRAKTGSTCVYLPESFPQVVLRYTNETKRQFICQQKQKVGDALGQLKCSHLIVPKAISCNNFLVEERLPINANIYHNLGCYLSEPELFDEPVREMVRLSSKFYIDDILTSYYNSVGYRYVEGVRYYPKYENLPLYSVKENGFKVGRIGLIDLDFYFPDKIDGRTLPSLATIFPLHEHIIREEADLLGLPYNEEKLGVAFARGNKCLKSYSDHADWLTLKGVTTEFMNWSFDISPDVSNQLNKIVQQELCLMNKGKSVIFKRNIDEDLCKGFLIGDFFTSAKVLSDTITPMIIANLKGAMNEHITQNTSDNTFTELTEDQIIFLRSPIVRIPRLYEGILDVLISSPCFCVYVNKFYHTPIIAEQLIHSVLSHLVTRKEILYYSQRLPFDSEKHMHPEEKICCFGY
ncbi:hypothetical protein [Endozoicomonas sp. SESOKO1]|uniref:hypothetical protein n=1 Tax=Endozoicomonas sp. SESOKO1 TaxID=2828742 RepID=UPI0021475674|nr:hypothetical protein [Endozoicomonas sp. SESOKO1]